jgi:hypothetical protein
MLLHEYNNGNKMKMIRTALEKAGLEYISYGAHAMVLRSKDGNVIKIFEPDPCYMDFLQIVKKNKNNPHFPKVRKIIRFKKGIFRGNYGIKMEPLTPLTREEYSNNIGFHCFLSINMPRSPYTLNTSDSIALDRYEATQWAKQNPEFASAIINISNIKAGCREDLHRENIMKRNDTWVITDPYAKD